MGGQSSSTQSQSSSTSPWAAAMPTVNSLFSGVNSLIPQSGLTGAQSGAIGQLTANGQAGNPYASAIGGVANNLLGGGGATNQAGAVNNAYQQYVAQTQPLASNTNYDPYSTPGIGDQLTALTNSISNGVNGQFAAAGRSGSGAAAQSLGQGLTAGLAPVLTNQFNANRSAQQTAAGNLYSAGNTTAGIQSGLTQQGVANQTQGVQTSNDALAAAQWGPQQVLQAQQLLQSIPAQNLGLLAQIGIPLAGLGTNSSGTSNTTNQASGATQFQQILSGIGSLIPKGPVNLNFGS